VTRIRQRKAAGMPQHVRVNREAQLCGHAGALDHPGETGCRERGAPFGQEDKRGGGVN